MPQVNEPFAKRVLWAIGLLALFYLTAPASTPGWLWAMGTVVALAVCFLSPRLPPKPRPPNDDGRQS
jgi:hypothetical protein